MILLLAALGCAGPETETDAFVCDGDGPTPTWTTFADGFFLSYCRGCHSEALTGEDRHDAPSGVDFDDEAQVAALAPRIRARVIDDGSMPVGGGVLDDDLALLDRYLACTLGVP